MFGGNLNPAGWCRPGAADGGHADAAGRGVGHLRPGGAPVHGAAPVHARALPPRAPRRRAPHAAALLAQRYR